MPGISSENKDLNLKISLKADLTELFGAIENNSKNNSEILLSFLRFLQNIKSKYRFDVVNFLMNNSLFEVSKLFSRILITTPEEIDLLALFAEILKEKSLKIVIENDKLKIENAVESDKQQDLNVLLKKFSPADAITDADTHANTDANTNTDVITNTDANINNKRPDKKWAGFVAPIYFIFNPLISLVKKTGKSLNNIFNGYKVPRSIFRLFGILAGGMGGAIGGAIAGAALGILMPPLALPLMIILGAVGAIAGAKAGSVVAKQITSFVSNSLPGEHIHPSNREKYTLSKDAVGSIYNKNIEDNVVDEEAIKTQMNQTYTYLIKLKFVKNQITMTLPGTYNKKLKEALNAEIKQVRKTGEISVISQGEIGQDIQKRMNNREKFTCTIGSQSELKTTIKNQVAGEFKEYKRLKI